MLGSRQMEEEEAEPRVEEMIREQCEHNKNSRVQGGVCREVALPGHQVHSWLKIALGTSTDQMVGLGVHSWLKITLCTSTEQMVGLGVRSWLGIALCTSTAQLVGLGVPSCLVIALC